MHVSLPDGCHRTYYYHYIVYCRIISGPLCIKSNGSYRRNNVRRKWRYKACRGMQQWIIDWQLGKARVLRRDARGPSYACCVFPAPARPCRFASSGLLSLPRVNSFFTTVYCVRLLLFAKYSSVGCFAFCDCVGGRRNLARRFPHWRTSLFPHAHTHTHTHTDTHRTHTSALFHPTLSTFCVLRLLSNSIFRTAGFVYYLSGGSRKKRAITSSAITKTANGLKSS